MLVKTTLPAQIISSPEVYFFEGAVCMDKNRGVVCLMITAVLAIAAIAASVDPENRLIGQVVAPHLPLIVSALR